MRRIASTLLMLWVSCASFASTSTIIEELALNGVSTLEQLRTEYFVGALYLENLNSNPEQISASNVSKAMDLRITTDEWSTRRFGNYWRQAIMINTPNPSATLASDIQTFTSLLPNDLIRGDQLTISFDPSSGTKVELNGQVAMRTDNSLLFDALLNTWIGARPPSTEFKQRMLQLNSDAATTQLLTRYQQIIPSEQRIATVNDWFAKDETEESTAGAGDDGFNFAPPSDSVTRSKAKQSAFAANLINDLEGFSEASAAPKPKAKPKAKQKPAVAKKAKPTGPSKEELAAQQKEAELAVQAAKEEEKRALLAKYSRDILRKTYQHTEYPERALNRNQEGRVVIKITLDRSGDVLSMTPVEQANYLLLNRAAERAIKRAKPYPNAPKDLEGDSFEVEVPFTFKISS